LRIPRQPPHLGRLQASSLTARQAELLDEIETLYLSEGFSRQTLDALASTLRCSKMTLYTLAPSREQLAVAVVRRYFERAAEEIEHEVLLRSSAAARAEAFIRTMATTLLEMSDVCFHEILGFEPTRRVYEEFARDRATVLAGLLDDLGPSRSRPPGLFVAEVVKVSLDSLCAREFEAETGIDTDEAVDHLVRLALLAAAPSTRSGRRPTGLRPL
jgi:AcrR family transcriptional regulator